MSDVNKVILVGRLGQEPERREFPDGGILTRLSVATKRWVPGKDGTGGHEETEWHRVVVRGKKADTCAKNLVKGQLVLVDGEVRMRKYDGKDGTPKVAFEVHAWDVRFLSKPRAQIEDADQPLSVAM